MPTSPSQEINSERPLLLRDLRKKKGLSQLAVASILGIAQCQISKAENRTDIRISTLQRYIRALGGELEFKVELNGQTFKLELPLK